MKTEPPIVNICMHFNHEIVQDKGESMILYHQNSKSKLHINYLCNKIPTYAKDTQDNTMWY